MDTSADRDAFNGARFLAGEPRGHYESWFCRANHPKRPLAFWIRYTIFVPKDRPKNAIGELWAIYFDGESRTVRAVKEEHPIRECTFAKTGLDARIAHATIDGDSVRGHASCGGHRIAWSLRYTTPKPPLLLLDRGLYGGSFPKAKGLVGSPHAAYSGTIDVDGEEHAIDGWIGSQNHNWGERHTDRYAWGQVAGFDDDPNAFLELITAQVKVGPLLTPALTVLVLRADGEEYAFNTIAKAARARGEYDYFRWTFATGDEHTRIEGTIAAAASDFVALPYSNPPGGIKTCLNCKIAHCDLTIRRHGRPLKTLSTRHRAAFEILTDDKEHGLPLLET